MTERATLSSEEVERRVWDETDESLEMEDVLFETVDTWRHGHVVRHTVADKQGRFWQAQYRVQTNGEWSELEDGDVVYREVFKTTETRVVYK
jgi:hypothetical protein